MRAAMHEAEVGDDVYGEDPTINRLEARAAEMLGMETALFFPSGTMANQASLRVHTRPGDVVLATRDSHVLRFESGAAAGLSGIQIETLGGEGHFDSEALRGSLPPKDAHYAPVTAVCIENTHNVAGGTVFPSEELGEIVGVARDAGLALHLDGARVFNAAVASNRPVAELAEPFDTVSFCLSKGLGAPVGSLVATREALRPALHRTRKMLGGGMRQAGSLAAAGLYALEHHVERLADDHRHARRLAEGLAELGFAVPAPPETNLVMFDVTDPAAFVRGCRARDLLINPMGPGRFRAALHLDVSSDDVEDALGRIAELG